MIVHDDVVWIVFCMSFLWIRGDHDNIKALERQLQELRDELGQAGDKNTRQMMEFTKLRESHDEEVGLQCSSANTFPV